MYFDSPLVRAEGSGIHVSDGMVIDKVRLRAGRGCGVTCQCHCSGGIHILNVSLTGQMRSACNLSLVLWVHYHRSR
jgi:hypothetical protein